MLIIEEKKKTKQKIDGSQTAGKLQQILIVFLKCSQILALRYETFYSKAARTLMEQWRCNIAYFCFTCNQMEVCTPITYIGIERMA